MILLLTVIAISTIYIFIDLVPLYKKQKWTGFFVYSVLLLFCILIALLMALNIKIPNLIEPIQKLITAIRGE
ncbi:MAG TPA: hypothetical protein DD738_00475 [Ruminiclostridium sp.]|jgi:hypothetical protein|nr:hypothetical protein [Ruminiclostridium sp.]